MMNVKAKQFYKIALLAGAATMLQGCVAAVIPLAAGGLMGGAGNLDGSKSREDVAASDVDATVIVNPSDAEAALVAEASAPVADPGLAERMPSPPARMPEPVTVTIPAEEPAQMAAAPSVAATTAVEEPEASASEQFNAAFTETPVEAPIEAPAAVAGQTSAADTARLVVIAEEDTPASVSAAPSAVEEPAVRRIAVDSQTALADTNAAAPNVSAAEAAAALINAAPEPQTPAPAPAAVVAAASTAEAVSSSVPSPSAAASPASSPSASSPLNDASAITSLISFANQRKFEFTPGEARESAMLIDRIKLSADRADCVGIQPTVLIDLDPEGGTFSPINAARPPAGLATGLSRLRAAGVAIAWISSGSSSYSEIYRDSLARSGLDESGADQLLLMRGPDDRKQIRREQLAQLSCLIAIAGDARSDFDELYDYLLNPGDAAVLEPLIGEGWFIIPTPLLSEGPTR